MSHIFMLKAGNLFPSFGLSVCYIYYTMSASFFVKVALCDIEGTTTSINFVKNILFPYSQNEMEVFLASNFDNSGIKGIVSDLLKLAKEENIGVDYLPLNEDLDKCAYLELAAKTINALIERDFKIQQLKTLQGLIWEKGYQEKKLKGHVFSDVPETFRRWTSDGIEIYIYSSGSEKAQKLLFANTEHGNMLKYISGHFGTRVGPKTEKESYSKITENLNCRPEDIIFFTDISKEAHAAKAAGLHVVLLNRPGNSILPEEDKKIFPIISTFEEVNLNLMH